MKRLIFVFPVILAFCAMCASTSTVKEPQSKTDDILANYFEALGGLDKIINIQNVSARVSIEVYEYEYKLFMMQDDLFRIEEPDQITIYDGNNYWMSFHGLTGSLSQDKIDELKDTSIRSFFFHDLLDIHNQPVTLDFVGIEQKHGKTFNVLASGIDAVKNRKYYFDTNTGLLDKIVELQDDEEFGQKKNVYNFSDYKDVQGIKLFTRTEAICLTTNETITPAVLISDIAINQAWDLELFTKPASTVPEATFKNGAVIGQVLGFSRAGSLITNITKSDMQHLDLKDGARYLVIIKEHVTKHTYLEDVRSLGSVGSGDYILLFNKTPALWIVKAYVGMKNDLPLKEGDVVKIIFEELSHIEKEKGDNENE